MNTKQLIVAWYAVVGIAVMVFIAGNEDTAGLLLRVLAILLAAGLLVYTFSAHNQANNVRVALFVLGLPVLAALAIGGGAYLVDRHQNAREEAELQAYFDSLDEVEAEAARLNRARRDSLKVADVTGHRLSYCQRVRSECLQISAQLTNQASATLTFVRFWVEVTDSAGHRVTSGSGFVELRLAPNETALVRTGTTAKPEIGENRRIHVAVDSASFLSY